MNTTTFPSIITVAYPHGPGPNVRFVKPSPDNGMVTQGSTEHKTYGDPKATTRRQIFMGTGEVTPAHTSIGEKVYIILSGTIIIVVWYPDGEKLFSFSTPGSTLVIPAGLPHAVICSRGPDVEGTPILTLFNSNPAAETTWEPDADELVKNLHITPPPQ